MDTGRAAGYSGTPLAKKLGIKEGSHVYVLNAPPGYAQLLEPLPPSVHIQMRASADFALDIAPDIAPSPAPAIDLAHMFVTQREELRTHLAAFRRTLGPDAALWVSWPKKASKVPTTVTEDTIRAEALPLGFVDIKVCAVNEVWSALKLVVRKTLR